jgi:hypothetical protein
MTEARFIPDYGIEPLDIHASAGKFLNKGEIDYVMISNFISNRFVKEYTTTDLP